MLLSWLSFSVMSGHTTLSWVCSLLIILKIGTAKSLVVVLLSLEFLSLSLLCAVSSFLFTSNLSTTFVLAFFTAVVCEACVGLGVLIKTSRTLGSSSMGNIT